MTNLLTGSSLSAVDIKRLLATARAFAQTTATGKAPPHLLSGQTVALMFFENSTRTRLSFETAVRRLGGSSLGFSSGGSSVQKGESLIDTALNIKAMGVHAMVIRHSSSGSPALVAQAVKTSVINAGDGFHEHPTQGLLDAYTLEDRLGDLQGKRVVILGDVLHSRVARSNLHILSRLGAQVTVCGPPTWIPPISPELKIRTAIHPDEVLRDADAVMTLRIQLERQGLAQIPSLAEYREFWGLTAERIRLLKPGTIILHPGPVNRGVEMDSEVADSENSVILDQVQNGIYVRMAVLASVCNPDGLERWLLGEGHHV